LLSDDLADSSPGPKEKVSSLVLVYLVGSDLESGSPDNPGGNAGTTSMVRMVQGVADKDPSEISLVVAYGGSNKPDWEGMTIISDEQLKPDAQDGIFGNERIADNINLGADMERPESRREKIGDITLQGVVKTVEGMLPDGIYASAYLSDDGTTQRRISDYECIRIENQTVSRVDPDEMIQ
jgi:hypothetical protein